MMIHITKEEATEAVNKPVNKDVRIIIIIINIPLTYEPEAISIKIFRIFDF